MQECKQTLHSVIETETTNYSDMIKMSLDLVQILLSSDQIVEFVNKFNISTQ